MINPIAIATGREHSLFDADIAANTDTISSVFSGRRVLVIGGAGSIGSATVRNLLTYQPSALHIVDQNENGLAELVRDVRSGGLVRGSLDFKLMPLDYGAPVTRRFLAGAGPYDVVLHFAALKHVRSEKDVASILQMIDTNVLKQRRLIQWIAEHSQPTNYFAVSTDKAANPANFMGASKRLMEILLFTEPCSPLGCARRTSARFANVAFSSGSLLGSFSERINRRQPIAVPTNTRRFFVSVDEAAQICLISAAVLADRYIAVPRMHAEHDQRELVPIAEGFLRAAGFTAVAYHNEEVARLAVEREVARGAWPMLLTPRDTEGEKESEVFVGADEKPQEIGLSALLGISQPGSDPAVLDHVLSQLQKFVEDPSASISKPELAALIRTAVNEFRPLETGRTLDERM
jgi:FlaA1/EpsC-like NDP-sugar epimerase